MRDSACNTRRFAIAGVAGVIGALEAAACLLFLPTPANVSPGDSTVLLQMLLGCVVGSALAWLALMWSVRYRSIWRVTLLSVIAIPLGAFAGLGQHLLLMYWFPSIFVAGSCAIGVIVYFILPSPVPPGHCHVCGYNLRFSVSGVCPECGAMVAGTSRRDDSRV